MKNKVFGKITCESCGAETEVYSKRETGRRFCSRSCFSMRDKKHEQIHDYQPTQRLEVNGRKRTIEKHCEHYNKKVKTVIFELNRGRTINQVFNRRVVEKVKPKVFEVNERFNVEDEGSLKRYMQSRGWN